MLFELPRGPAEREKLLLSLHRLGSGTFLTYGNRTDQVQPLGVSENDSASVNHCFFLKKT